MTTRLPLKSSALESVITLGHNFKRPFQKTTQGKTFQLFFYFCCFFRWIVYDLEFQESDGRKCSKLCYFLYSPDDNADNTEKFVVACNKDQVKSKISEVNRDFQVNRWDDLKEEDFIKAFSN